MQTALWHRVIYFAHLLTALALTSVGFGAVLARAQAAPLPGRMIALLAAAVVAVVTLPLSARPFWRTARNELLFSTLVPAFATAVALAGVDAWALTLLPPWPARVLHGASPEVGPEAWGRIQSLDASAQRNNSWGQRDVEHALVPTSGVPRIAFVGDSMLEESSITPLPTLVQQRLGKQVEIVNLGVSATNTEEYFWRVKKVALPLGSDHVVTFFYVGNDFMAEEPWSLRRALVDVPPADSLFGRLLPGVTGVILKNAHVPVRAWLSQSPLHPREVAAMERFRAAGPDGVVDQLMTHYRGSKTSALREELSRRDLRDFYAKLIAPDMGLFRSYVLNAALSALAGDVARDDRSTAEPEIAAAARLLDKMRALTAGNNARLTVVLVPVCYDVDDRFVRIWAPLIDFKTERAFSRWRLERLKSTLVDQNFDVLDLSAPLDGREGTYLDFDGHWSTLGNEIAAAAVAGHLSARYGGQPQ